MEKSKSTINGVTLLNSVCLFKTMQFAASTSRGIKIVHYIYERLFENIEHNRLGRGS